MWNEVLTSGDIDNLMELYGGFHDSCIKEMSYVSGACVNENDLSMFPINDERTLKVIFQRQERPVTVELEFSGLIKLNLTPNNEKSSCEIFESTLVIKDGCFYWGDCGDLNGKFDKYKGTWICSEKLRWRTVYNEQ